MPSESDLKRIGNCLCRNDDCLAVDDRIGPMPYFVGACDGEPRKSTIGYLGGWLETDFVAHYQTPANIVEVNADLIIFDLDFVKEGRSGGACRDSIRLLDESQRYRREVEERKY